MRQGKEKREREGGDTRNVCVLGMKKRQSEERGRSKEKGEEGWNMEGG